MNYANNIVSLGASTALKLGIEIGEGRKLLAGITSDIIPIFEPLAATEKTNAEGRLMVAVETVVEVLGAGVHFLRGARRKCRAAASPTRGQTRNQGHSMHLRQLNF